MATQYPLHHVGFIYAFIQKVSAFALTCTSFFVKPTTNLSRSSPSFIVLLASALHTSQAFHHWPTKLDSVSLDSRTSHKIRHQSLQYFCNGVCEVEGGSVSEKISAWWAEKACLTPFTF